MFDFSWGELLLIGAVALIVIGPKELPAVLRTVGQWTTKIRRMAGEFQSQFQEAMREAEMADLKKEVDAAMSIGSNPLAQFDPLEANEKTKWEPKTDPDGVAKGDDGAKLSADAAASDAGASPATVTADGHSVPALSVADQLSATAELGSAHAPAGEVPVAPDLPAVPTPAAVQSAVASEAPVPEGSGRE